MKNNLSGTTRPSALLRHIQPLAVWLLAVVLIGLGGCRKDVMNDINSIEQSPVAGNLTVDKAKKWWKSAQSVNFRTEGADTILTSLNVTPIWDRAFTTTYQGTENIVLAPFTWQGQMAHLGHKGAMYLVVHYSDSTHTTLQSKLIGFVAANEYVGTASSFNIRNFSGYSFQVGEHGRVFGVLKISDGKITHQLTTELNSNEIDFRNDPETGCFSFSSGWFGRLMAQIGNFFENVGDAISQFVSMIGDCFGSGDTGGIDGDVIPYENPFWNPDWDSFNTFGNLPPIGTPGGGEPDNRPPSLGTYFNNDIFAMARYMELLMDFSAAHELTASISQLAEIVNPACSETPEIFNACALNSVLNWLGDLSSEQRARLQSDNAMLDNTIRFVAHLKASGYADEEIDSFMDGWFEDYGAFDGLTEDEEGVICCNPPVVINNGITLANMTTPGNSTLFSGLIKVGYSVGTYPDNFEFPGDDPEDIRSGTNADARGIYLDMKPAVQSPSGNVIVPARPYTDSELFDFMTPLFMATTHCDNRSIAFLFKEQFRTNTERGKFFYHRPLSDKVMTHPVMKNYMKSFGKQLNDKLSTSNGLMISQAINMGTERPQFNKNCSDLNIVWYDRFHGYQILINDTQAVDIYLIPGSYIYDANTKVWRGRFTFVVTDHFGLDKQDAIDYQWLPLGDGFSAWWRLQHTRGYKPFRTRIIISADIQGKLN